MLIVIEQKGFDRCLKVLKELGKADVFLPRPLNAEKIAKIKKYAGVFFMPESTYKRLSRKAKEIIGKNFVLKSFRGRFAKKDFGLVQEIVSLHKAGVSIRKIAEDTGIPKSTVHYILNQGLKIEDKGIKIIINP